MYRLFLKGEAVMSTPLAIKNGIFGSKKYGQVAATSNEFKDSVSVRVDGNSTAGRFHKDFWKPDDFKRKK